MLPRLIIPAAAALLLLSSFPTPDSLSAKPADNQCADQIEAVKQAIARKGVKVFRLVIEPIENSPFGDANQRVAFVLPNGMDLRTRPDEAQHQRSQALLKDTAFQLTAARQIVEKCKTVVKVQFALNGTDNSVYFSYRGPDIGVLQDVCQPFDRYTEPDTTWGHQDC